MDANVSPKHDVPLWNETRWNGCWNADAGVGLYLHAGRYRSDLDMWWAQIVTYLPDGQLCVDRRWGRNQSSAGVRFDGFELAMTEDGWTATCDGVGEVTSTAALAQGARGSSAPVASMRFDVTATPAAPVWDMYAGVQEQQSFAGDTHVQQGFMTTGSMTVGGTEYALDGIGFKDHSSGPRDWANWYGHRFFLIVTEEWTCHAIVMFTPDGTPGKPIGAFIRDGQESALTRFDLPPLEDAAGGPINGELVIETASGEAFTFACELIHALPMLMTFDNDYVNGVDWDMAGDPIVLIEGKGRLTAPDGTVAYCFHERSALRSAVTRPGG